MARRREPCMYRIWVPPGRSVGGRWGGLLTLPPADHCATAPGPLLLRVPAYPQNVSLSACEYRDAAALKPRRRRSKYAGVIIQFVAAANAATRSGARARHAPGPAIALASRLAAREIKRTPTMSGPGCALSARDKNLLAYFDIRLGNQPDGRLTKFIGTNLPMVLPDAGGHHDEPRVPLRCSLSSKLETPR